MVLRGMGIGTATAREKLLSSNFWPSILRESNETTLQSKDGVILLFNVGDPVPVCTWFVEKVRNLLTFSTCFTQSQQPNGCNVIYQDPHFDLLEATKDRYKSNSNISIKVKQVGNEWLSRSDVLV